MIVPMKQVSLLVLEKYRQESLIALRKLGLLHIKYIKPPSSPFIDSLEKGIDDAQKALLIISKYQLIDKQPKQIDKKNILDCVSSIISLDREREDYINKKEDIIDKIAWYKDWGAFSLNSLRELAKAGIYIRLYKCNKKELGALRRKSIAEIIKRKGNIYYIAVISFRQTEQLGLQAIALPAQGLEMLKQELNIIEDKIASLDGLLREVVSYKQALSDHLNDLNKTLDFNKVKSSMKEAGEIVCLQGFIPQAETRRLTDLANKNGWAYLIQDPTDPQEVPTLIKNPRWLRIIEPVFKFMGTLPGYNEYDISFNFLLFFSLFFALLIGDGGYGLIFLIITYLMRKRMTNLSSEPFILMYVLSIVTVLWGALSGTWFGFERIAQLPFLKSIVVDRINSFIDGNQSFMMYVCFFIGALHLTIAHSTVALRIINSLKALAQLGWIMIVWSLFFVAGKLVLGRELYEYTGFMLSLGLLLVLLFSYPQKNVLKGIGITLLDLPFRVINSFSDIISYLRLFAVGYASVIMASSFNNIALSLGFNNIGASFVSAIILFLGHGLNIILGLMGVIVHGIRLNMLEFSSHLGMQWSGIRYKPFKD